MNRERDIDAPVPRHHEQEKRNPVSAFAKKNTRIRLFYVLYSALFLYLLLGMGWRQLFQSNEYRLRGEQQSLRRVLQPGPRGFIYDREGKLLVGTRPRRSAVVYLSELRDEFNQAYFDRVRAAKERNEQLIEEGKVPLAIKSADLRLSSRTEVLQRYLNKINAVIGRDEKVDERAMARHFSQRLLLPFPLIHDLTPREYASITEQIPVNSPIQIYTDSARFYPYREAACHVLGYVGRSDAVSDDEAMEFVRTFALQGHKGRSGLERQFDAQLAGTTGERIWRVDPVGYQYELVHEKESERGESLICSLDIDLQQTAENALGYMTGAVVALDVRSGEVLVLASKPNYDLNDLSPFIPRTVFDRIEAQGGWLNRAIQGLYPPGSTFKIITGIAAMRHAGIDPLKEFECGSSFLVGNREFPEHGGNSFGLVNLVRALEKSSNVYCYQVAIRTGIRALAGEATRFGLGERTGIELPFEGSGVVPTPEWKKDVMYENWVTGDTANLSIGQGYLLSTPLQMAAVTASVARRETRTIPTILHAARGNPSLFDHGAEPIGLTDSEYATLVKGMERAAGPEGTARRIQIPNLRIAAKTGSAEFRSQGKELTLAWTIAFAPIENPKIAIAVMVEGTNPDDNYHGGSTAAPIARAVLEHYFRKNKP